MSLTGHHDRMLIRLPEAAVLLSVALLLSGCGYTFRSTLDDRYQTVHVAAFSNDTGEYGLQASLTNAVIRKFKNDGRLRVRNTPDADIIVTGSIVDYELRGLTFGEDDQPLQFLNDFEVFVTVRDARTNEVMWADGISSETVFLTDGTPLASSRLRGNTAEFALEVRSFRTGDENIAATEAIEQVASEIFIRTVEPW